MRGEAGARSTTSASTSRFRKGLSLLEVVVSILLFFLLFSAVMSGFAPSATDSHNQLRGYTSATVVANWFINRTEAQIERYFGAIPFELGVEHDITPLIKAHVGEQISLLHNLQVLAWVVHPIIDGTPNADIFAITAEVRWGNHAGDSRPHRFKLSRWKVKPNA